MLGPELASTTTSYRELAQERSRRGCLSGVVVVVVVVVVVAGTCGRVDDDTPSRATKRLRRRVVVAQLRHCNAAILCRPDVGLQGVNWGEYYIV